MQLTINIKNSNTAEKILWMLEHFKSDGVEIIKSDAIKKDETVYSDEYIEENWKTIVSKALENYDLNYENSLQFKLDRAEFLEMKGRL